MPERITNRPEVPTKIVIATSTANIGNGKFHVLEVFNNDPNDWVVRESFNDVEDAKRFADQLGRFWGNEKGLRRREREAAASGRIARKLARVVYVRAGVAKRAWRGVQLNFNLPVDERTRDMARYLSADDSMMIAGVTFGPGDPF